MSAEVGLFSKFIKVNLVLYPNDCGMRRNLLSLMYSLSNAINLPNVSGNVDNWLKDKLSTFNEVKLPNDSGNVDNWLLFNCCLAL